MSEESNLELKLSCLLEGSSDYRVIENLIRGVIDSFIKDGQLQPFTLTLLNPPAEKKSGYGFLKQLPSLVELLVDNGVQIVVAVVDSGEGKQWEKKRKQEVSKAKKACETKLPDICIATGVAVREMEAWLLYDKDALKRVFNERGDSNRFPYRPDEIPKPKELLFEIARDLTNNKIRTVAPKLHLLAENIDLEILAQKCSSFKEFKDNLLECLKSWQESLALKIES